jgi:hypothetical protein
VLSIVVAARDGTSLLKIEGEEDGIWIVIFESKAEGDEEGDRLSDPSHSIRTTFEPLPPPSLVTIKRPQSSNATSTGRKPSSHCAFGGLCANRSSGWPTAVPFLLTSTYTTLYPVGTSRF